MIEKDINFAEEDEASTPDDDIELSEIDSYGPPKIRYYESDNALGQLYREIDEFEILRAIQEHSRPNKIGQNQTRSLVDAVWSYVCQKTTLILWEHHKDFARDVKEK